MGTGPYGRQVTLLMPALTLQAAFSGGELSPSLTARVDMAQYAHGCRTLKNFMVQPHGGAVKRPGFLLLDALPGEAALLKFSFNTEQSYCLAFGNGWLRVFTKDGPVLNSQGNVYQISTPYTLAQAKRLSSAQSGDVLYLAVHGVGPRKLMRYGHADWRFETMTFEAPIAAPMWSSIVFVNGAVKDDGTPSEPQLVTPYAYFITTVDSNGRESGQSASREITGPPPNNWQGGDYIKLNWNAVAGADEYRIYKSTFGGRAGYAGKAGGTTWSDYNTAPSFTEGVPKYENPFPNNDWPGLVGLYEQRLLLASTPNRPQTIWLSKSGNYGNFAIYTPIVDDAPLELTIASAEVSALVWAGALRTLMLGATGMEWEVSSSQGAFTAKTAKVSPQSYVGSAPLPALIVGNTVLHVARNRAQVRDLKYDFGSDSYRGSDCTIMAAHLFERYKIMDWTYQQHPDSIVWVVREDGVLLGLTYQAEHQIFAWHRHDTLGRFKDVCSIPAGREDVLFALVERSGVYYMEVMAPSYAGGDYRRAVFLDSALVYDKPGVQVTRLYGLGHLEGKTVGVLAGGAVHLPQVVRSGEIALDCPVDLAIVGLPYVSDLETMPVELAGPQGATVGRKKQVNEVNILFRETVGAKVGLGFDILENIKWRSDEPHGTPPRPYSGIRNVVVTGLAETQVTVCIRSDEPVPMTVLAVTAKLDPK